MKTTVLLADNDARFREVWGKVLLDAGYDVRRVSSPQQTRNILRDVGFDLAILDLANARTDTHHRELLQTYWLELLLSACEQLPAERQVACTERAICAAMDNWFAFEPDVEGRQPKGQEDSQDQGG